MNLQNISHRKAPQQGLEIEGQLTWYGSREQKARQNPA
jgi:hypothetical protein